MSVVKRIVMLFLVLIALAIFTKLEWSDAAVDPILAAGLRKFKDRVSAPDFSLQGLDGNNLRLDDFRGKIVLLNFWATW
jgi:cytochrome oxidase Cu insertion factor (SCO1/SenC/PrrC family)